MRSTIIILPTSPNIIKMEIKMHLSHDDIFAFLHTKGYEVKPWLYCFTDEIFPEGKTYHEIWTFTATKSDQIQSENNLFLRVFETEIKNLLKEV